MDNNLRVKLIEDSTHFRKFISENPHYYIVHLFNMVDDNTLSDIWHVGYYSKDADKIVVFEYNNGVIHISEPEDALKEDGHINKLDLDTVKVSSSDALKISNDAVKEFYPKEISTKHIFLLQNLPEHGNIWNATIVTMTFSVINIKIDAITGTVLKHHRENLMNWKKE